MDKRKRRVKRLKVILVVLFLVFLLLPSLLCGIMFWKLHRLSKEVEELKEAQSVVRAMAQDTPQNVSGKSSGEQESSEKLTPLGAKSETSQKPEKNGQSDRTDQTEKTGKAGQESGQADGKVRADADLSGKRQDQQKTVYLTFDDGPGQNTEAILDILKEYQVHATFFVVGKEDENSLELYKRIVEEGHTLGMHSYSHSYAEIYDSLKAFQKDYKKISRLLKETTGIEPKFYRFPGGSSNQVSKEPMTVFADYLSKKGITYFDWNVESGDAVAEPPDADQLCKNVLAGVKKHQSSVVLLHDLAGKETTVEALPMILDSLLKEGADVLAIDAGTKPVQHTIVQK